MASTKLAFLAIAVVLLQVSWCVVAQQAAVMAVTSFKPGNRDGPAECGAKYHSDKELVVAMATKWFKMPRICSKNIRITNPQNGRNLVAAVVDECDTKNGCKDNMIATTKSVWDKLGLDTDIGEVPVTWSFA